MPAGAASTSKVSWKKPASDRRHDIKMPKFQRTLEAGKAMHPDALLAWEMNGKPLTADDAFPLRVIAPGWPMTPR